MEISTKELRIQPGKIIAQVVSGQEITVTFRGKALAKIIPFKQAGSTEEKGDRTMFGLWKDHNDIDDVDAYVRNIRKGRQF